MLEAETKELRLLFIESNPSHFVVLKLSEDQRLMSLEESKC